LADNCMIMTAAKRAPMLADVEGRVKMKRHPDRKY
jgi:hypothetical protein